MSMKAPVRCKLQQVVYTVVRRASNLLEKNSWCQLGNIFYTQKIRQTRVGNYRSGPLTLNVQLLDGRLRDSCRTGE